MTKTCPRCGAAFGCSNPEPGCWCEGVSVPADRQAVLASRYENCLCPGCLKAVAGGET